jgi:hypothetical protein
MSEINRDKVMKRIQKLLNLHDGNKNEHEAMAAMTKAQEMMNEFHISEVEARESGSIIPPKEVKEAGSDWSKLSWYKKAIADVIARNFKCYYFFRTSNGKTRMIFMGLKDDAELALTVYEFALLAIEYNADEYVKERRQLEYIRNSAPIKTDYMRGFIRGLNDKFKKQVEDHKQEWGLVLQMDALVVQKHEMMKFTKAPASKGGRNGSGDADAYGTGYEKGSTFESAKGFVAGGKA